MIQVVLLPVSFPNSERRLRPRTPRSRNTRPHPLRFLPVLRHTLRDTSPPRPNRPTPDSCPETPPASHIVFFPFLPYTPRNFDPRNTRVSVTRHSDGLSPVTEKDSLPPGSLQCRILFVSCSLVTTVSPPLPGTTTIHRRTGVSLPGRGSGYESPVGRGHSRVLVTKVERSMSKVSRDCGSERTRGRLPRPPVAPTPNYRDRVRRSHILSVHSGLSPSLNRFQCVDSAPVRPRYRYEG